MGVWPSFENSAPPLYGSEGALVSVSIHVEPRYLEDLLDALARLEFPINPQIYHDAAIVYRYPDGREECEPTTIVEFPAYEGRLPEVRTGLAAYGFAEECVHVGRMLDEMHAEAQSEPGPAGARWVSRVRRKHAHAVTAA